jgi:hypothetical protein
MPPHGDGSALGDLISALNWFAICDPDAKTSIRIARRRGLSIERRNSRDLDEHRQELSGLS